MTYKIEILASLIIGCVCFSFADAQSPHWIWSTQHRSQGQRVAFSKSLDVNKGLTAARLQLAADFNRCTVLLNDRIVVELDEYAPWQSIDLTDDLRPGENSLELKCLSGKGPAAVAVSLSLDYSDGKSEVIDSNSQWRGAVSLGRVAPEMWDSESTAKISAFDNYEQWRQATGAEKGTDPVSFATRPGFEVSLVRSAKPDESSWVSMAFDPKGRVTIAREDKGLLRMVLSDDGNRVQKVETIEDTLLEIRGLIYAHDSLYVNANNSKGMYRLTDTNDDGKFDETKLLREFPGSVGHGRNDLALGPDGWIYSIHGDAVDLPTENVLDLTPPLNADRNPGDKRLPQGCLIRTDKDGKRWEILSRGLRNPFGIDFNEDGEVFTYDADNEYDMGSAWYRPTRFNQLVSGADFGWRRTQNGGWPPYFPDRPDNALPVVDVGKGSPTAVKFGARSSFPPAYRRAMFVLDWAYGRILAHHLSPRGAGYACRVEQFLKGRPLNVTDLGFGPDGSMYFVTGGRKTQSALYRVRYVGESSKPRPSTIQQTSRNEFSAQMRSLNRRLAEFHRAEHDDAIETAWPHLSNPDPVIRQTARVAIEHQPLSADRNRALNESNGEIAVTALMTLARSGELALREKIAGRLHDLEIDSLSAYGKLTMIRTYRLCLSGDSKISKTVESKSKERLLGWLAEESSDGQELSRAPLGSGDGVWRELARLVSDLKIRGATDLFVTLLSVSESQRDRMQSLYLLCTQQGGWTKESRKQFFEALRELELSAFSGAGMPGRLGQIREKVIEHLSDADKKALGELIKQSDINSGKPLVVDRTFVKKWTLDGLAASVSDSSKIGDVDRGEKLFREVQCFACHRMNGRGGVLGPDLSSVASRFSQKDILASIIEPSSVIAEKYQGMKVVTTDGKVINGRVATGGDYRSTVLRLVADPLKPGEITEIPKSEIEVHQPSKVSPMPAGLLDTLTVDDVLDLLAYLRNDRE